MWALLIYFMHDNVLSWLSSPFMMFLLVSIAGTVGYLFANGKMHYITSGYQTLKFFYNQFMVTAKKSLEENKKQDEEKK